MLERGREVGEGRPEGGTERQVGEGEGKRVDWIVEGIAKGKPLKRGGEALEWLIIVLTKSEGEEGRRVHVARFHEPVAEGEMGERGGK